MVKPQLGKRIVLGLVALLLVFLFASGDYAQMQWSSGTTPTKLTIQATLVNQNTGVLKGLKNVTLRIYDGASPKGQAKTYNGVAFSNGVFSLTFDAKDLVSQQQFMSLIDPKLTISVDGENATVPLYSTPFSVQSRVAESALSVDAAGISGDFASANIAGDLIVNGNTLVVSSNVGRVGIGTSLPSTALDVAGVVNAKGYKVGGVDLESSFSWIAKNPNSSQSQLYYDRGFVGIGLVTPSYMLDVAGTVNAKEFRINGLNLSSFLRAELAWQNGPDEDIYFDDGVLPNGGYVGIGTTDPQEKLDIRGGIRIGKTKELSPKAGTIQYVTDISTGKGDFWGFNGTEWLSLTGIQGAGTSGNIAFWRGGRTLAGSSNLFWNQANGFLGVGTNIPDARLTVRASSTTAPVFNVVSATNEPLFYVSPLGIGIGTTTPIQKLDVKGIVNAQGYRVNGKPLEFALSSDSYWLLENEGRIFYDKGFVGIGTTSPSNMLELASATGNPSITFGVAGQRLFTMGIGADNPDAFIIGKGANLAVPVFTFKNENIGVGLSNPRANLHVSGNSGVIVSGQFDSSTVFLEQGRGSKFIWFPGKAVIRGGYAQRDEWDDANLGVYSVAFGYGTIASGSASVVAGGYRNRASGAYSAVMGGLLNQANGDYSFAAGHEAIARTPGSFVWADYTPTSDVSSFISSAPNQFLIRANGGVGIGTTLTAGAALTINDPRPKEYILNSTGVNGAPVLVVTTSGNMGVGLSDPGASQLAVSGSVSIGTTTPRALLTVMAPAANTANLMYIAPVNSPTAAMLITASGNVGIGITNGDVFTANDVNSLFVAGGIKASEFKVVDPNDPNQTITIQPNPGSPWSDPSKNGGNTFRSTGFVGIGTPSPNNLLELSNRNASGDIPVLTFDIAGSDKYSLGVVTPNSSPTTYLFSVAPGGGLANEPALIISSSSVGIGIGIKVPSATLQVSGNAIFGGNVAIGTSNVASVFNLNVGGALNTDELYIAGQKFENKDTPWKTLNLNIYYTSGNVGIGTSTPTQILDVAGTIRAKSFLTTDPIRIDGSLYSNGLFLQNSTGNIYGKLFVDNSQLKFASPPDAQGLITTKTISSPLQKATDNVARSGKFAFFADDSTLGQAEVYWNSTGPQLAVSGNFVVKRLLVDSGMHVTQNVGFGGASAVVVTANLSHDGNLASVRGYTAQSVDVSIDKNWGNLTTVTDVKGLDVNMKTQSSTVLNYASVVGLNVDVSGVAVDSTNGGRKYAAIFSGGNVGIGTSRPQAELEVAGTVSANYFNLTGGLNVPELVVNGGQADSATFVAKTTLLNGKYLPRVGLGISNPQEGTVELAVDGVVSANSFVVNGGLTATTININSGAFVVDSVGNIGIGTPTPDSPISIRKLINGVQSSAVISQKVNLVIDGARPGSVFSLDQDLVGMNVTLGSESGSQLNRTAKGIVVDMSGLTLSDVSNATGLYVDVTGTTGKRYAGLFQGGFVGIGTSTPQAELHVSGNIKADNLLLAGTLSADSATFNSLVVLSGATLNGTVTVNRLAVQGNLTANSIVIQNAITAPKATFSDFISNTVSVNTSLKTLDLDVANKLTGKSAYFDGVGIGTAIPTSGLSVSGSVLADTITVSDQLTLSGAVLNVNSGVLYTDSTQSRVGIGTTTPMSALHIVTGGGQQFDSTNTLSWNPVTIHNRNTSSGAGAGILFTTDSLVSANTGAGIVAIRSSSTLANPGSHLVFVTDPEADPFIPNSGEALERMRITSAGNIGIGTTLPTAMLHVVGDATVRDSLLASALDVGTISNSSGELTISSNTTVVFKGTVSANSDVKVGKGLYFAPIPLPTDTQLFGRLFVSNVNNSLYYLPPSSTSPFNISSAYTGRTGRIPFFDDQGNLADSAPILWSTANNMLTIGTANQMTRFQLGATINNSTSGGTYALHQMTMRFGDRSTFVQSSNTQFTGLDVVLTGQNPDSVSTFGRLGQGETAVGLRVDLTGLQATQYVNDIGLTQGYKYAAAFLGGNVGVGTTRPDAGLHIVQQSGGVPFRVDTQARSNALMVSAAGLIGINTGAPSASLTIVATDNSSSGTALEVANFSGSSLFRVKNDGKVGIGTSTPKSTLEVNGTLEATNGQFTDLIASSLVVGTNNAFVVTEEGNIGIGTSLPSGNLHFYKAISPSSPEVSQTTPFVAQKLDLSVGTEQAQSEFYFSKDVTMLDISLASQTGSKLGDNSSGVAAHGAGVSINMTSLNLASNSTAVGLNVNVGGSTGTRYAGIFLGGNVGIGTSNPTAALSVSGDIKADKIILSKGIDAGWVTVNSLVVRSGATINGTVTAAIVVADTVSANNLVVNGALQIATASFSTVNVTRVGSFARLGVGGISNPVNDLEVSGNVIITGNLTVSGSLKVTTINSYASDLTIKAPGNVYVSGSMTVSSDITLLSGSVLLPTMSSVVDSATYARLYADSTGHLVYKKPGTGTVIPISKSLLGTANAIAFFGSDGMLTSSPDVYWNPSLRTMVVGTTNAITSFQLVSSLNVSSVGTFNGQLVDMRIGNRTTLTNSVNSFYGLDIQMAGLNSGSEIGFGRLAQGEKAVGLRVDMTTLRGRYTSVDPIGGDTSSLGLKYAAAFLGGGVGIGTSLPGAALHVVSELSSDAVFRVDTAGGDISMLVSGNGMVGIGNSAPTSRLSVKSKGSTAALYLENSTGSLIMTATSNGSNVAVGIGTSLPRATLAVSANAIDVPFRVDVTGKSFPSIIVSQNGSVGVGTSNPQAMLHVFASSAAPLRVGVPNREYGLVVDSQGYVGVGLSNPLSELHTDGIFMSGQTSSLPSIISSSVSKATGLLAATSNYYTFIGNLDRNDGTGVNSVVAWSGSKLRFTTSYSGADTDVMVFATNNVGIGTSNPTAKLEVVSTNATNAVLSVRGNSGVQFVVTGDGKVGVGTSMPRQMLDVSGNARIAGSLLVDYQVSTNVVTVNDYILLSKTVAANSTGSAQLSQLILNGDTNGDIVGLDILLNANPNVALGGQRKYTVWDGAAAIGISSDLTGVNVTDPGTGQGGYKYAGIFKGGYVGIGTTRPTVPLQVEGTQTTASDGSKTADLFKAGTTNGSMTLRDFDNGRIGFVTKGPAGVEYTTLVMAPPDGSDTVGRVGIGVTNPDKALVVNGDVRIGKLTPAGMTGTPTASLYFSGGPDVSGSDDSDNGIPMSIRRSNITQGQSQLQVVIGTSNSSTSKFVVGADVGGAYKPIMTVQMDGKVGITDGLSPGTFIPKTNLHVMGAKQSSGAYLENHVMAVENSAASNGDALAIQFKYTDAQALTTDHHFMTFYADSDTSYIGAIQSNSGGTGVRFLSKGADYAEYLEKVNPKELIELGDIVGVVNGKVSKDTSGAQVVMARSYAATVAGNHPNVKQLDRYELIAFFGQVKVKVRGAVKAGDYLIASGMNDGTAIAVAPSAITAAQTAKIVGTAWESSVDAKVKLIHTAVGFGFSAPTQFNETSVLIGLQDDLAAAKLERRKVVDQINQRLSDQDKELDLLLKQLDSIKSR